MKNTTLIFSRKFFELEKILFCKTFFSISIQKVPRNPKIILRTPCDHFKDTKNIASKKILIFADIDDYRFLLRGATLNYEYLDWAQSFCLL